MPGRSILFGLALAAMAAGARADVTLLAPRAGERLDGGREATLAWSARSLPPDAEEWEAFLSLDGGAYYAVRITPHLDTGVRTFRFRVPNVASTRARLLLRVGNETDEHLIELPEVFTIVPGWAPLDFAVASEEEGEAAIPGGAPSREWVSADHVRHRSRQAVTSNAPSLGTALPRETACTVAGGARLQRPDLTDREELPRNRRVAHPSPRSSERSILLLTTRLNI